MQERG
jgi:hypothetical protein